MSFKDEILLPGFSDNNPFSSGCIRYLTTYHHGWHEVNLGSVLAQQGSIDFNSLITTIVLGRNEGKTSLLNGVECIVPGYSFRIQDSSGSSSVTEYVEWQKLTDNKKMAEDPAEVLYQIISEAVSRAHGLYFVIRLSGGLDSTGILLALMESVEINRIIAVTYSYRSGSSNEDEITTRKLCHKYGIRLIVIEYEPNSIFHRLSVPVAPVMNMRVINYKMYEKEINLIKNICGDNFIIFDGHGGDHVFCEKIPPSISKELLYQGHPVKALKSLLQLARLYGISFKDVFSFQNTDNTLILKEAQNYFIPDAIKHLKPLCKNINDDRKSTLQDAMLDNGTALTLDTSKYDFFPFTDKRMIGLGLHLKVDESFNGSCKRIQYRNAIYDRYNFSFTRRDKGHITGAYQVAMNVNKTRVLNLIRNGHFASHNLIELSKVEDAIEIASRGIGGVSFILMRIIAAEIIFEGYTI